MPENRRTMGPLWHAFLYEVNRATGSLMYLLQGMESVRQSELAPYNRMTPTNQQSAACFPKLPYVGVPLSMSGIGFDLNDVLERQGDAEQLALKGWVEKIYFLWESRFRNELRQALAGAVAEPGAADEIATVNLTWLASTVPTAEQCDTAYPLTGYTVVRSDGDQETNLGSADAGATSFTDSTAAFGTNYTYRVAARSAIGASPASETAVTVFPRTVLPATGLTASTADPFDGNISLSWDVPTEGPAITGYLVLRYLGADPFRANWWKPYTGPTHGGRANRRLTCPPHADTSPTRRKATPAWVTTTRLQETSAGSTRPTAATSAKAALGKERHQGSREPQNELEILFRRKGQSTGYRAHNSVARVRLHNCSTALTRLSPLGPSSLRLAEHNRRSLPHSVSPQSHEEPSRCLPSQSIASPKGPHPVPNGEPYVPPHEPKQGSSNQTPSLHEEAHPGLSLKSPNPGRYDPDAQPTAADNPTPPYAAATVRPTV